MSLKLDPGDPTPLWRQLELAVRRLVASGSLTAGQPMPSVRDMAQELGVNPATVSKGYQRLTEAGILEVRRGEGTYVSAGSANGDEAALARELRHAAERYAVDAATLGADVEQAVRELRAAWGALQRPRRRG
jgi:GntR family transcriptional regulator